MNREEHLRRVKIAASSELRELRPDAWIWAIAVMIGGLQDHPELKHHGRLQQVFSLFTGEPDVARVNRWIQGFR